MPSPLSPTHAQLMLAGGKRGASMMDLVDGSMSKRHRTGSPGFSRSLSMSTVASGSENVWPQGGQTHPQQLHDHHSRHGQVGGGGDLDMDFAARQPRHGAFSAVHGGSNHMLFGDAQMEMDEVNGGSRFDRFPPASQHSPTHYHKATAHWANLPPVHGSNNEGAMNDVDGQGQEDSEAREWQCAYGGASDIY